MTFHPDSLPDLTGKVYIVTGGTSGIGYWTVARLAQHGAHVYLCARSSSKGTDAVARITAKYPSAHISVLEMDHMSLASVSAAAKSFLEKETALHGLVNNAGIMATPFEMSKDGHESQWQTNYLAHWLFTRRLVPLMLETSKSLPPGNVRVVNLSSGGHLSAPKGGINFEDTSLKNSGGMPRYAQSKLANILHTKTLHAMYGPGSASAKDGNGEIWSTAIHPGLVETNLATGSELPVWVRLLIAPLRMVGGSVDADKGSWTNVYCAASPDLRGEDSGAYFQRLADPKGWQSGAAKDPKLAADLEMWTSTLMEKEGWIDE